MNLTLKQWLELFEDGGCTEALQSKSAQIVEMIRSRTGNADRLLSIQSEDDKAVFTYKRNGKEVCCHMKKTLLGLIVFMGLSGLMGTFFSASADDLSILEAIRERGVLKVGTAGDYQPMSYLDKILEEYRKKGRIPIALWTAGSAVLALLLL